MLPLIETVIGFAVIMLMLSFLAKSLSSVFKNHFEFYSKNFKSEVERLIRGTIGKNLADLEQEYPELKDIQWKRLGEEFLDRKNMEWLLGDKLGATREQLKHLDARLKVHIANVRYAFEKRTKNITLALGLSL